jgi:hypothetical protein
MAGLFDKTKDGPELGKLYFGNEILDGTSYNCKECGISRKKTNGWSALTSHIYEKHKDFPQKLEEARSCVTGGMDLIVAKASSKAKKIFGWLKRGIMTNKPSSFVENIYERENITLDKIGVKTYNKYRDKVYEIVCEKLAKELPKSFGILIDCWSCAREHYHAIFATWTNTSGGVIERLLACGVQDLPDDEIDGHRAEDVGFSAEDFGDYLFDVLAKFGKTFEAIEFVSGDNASVNARLCNLLEQWLSEHKQIVRKVYTYIALHYIGNCFMHALLYRFLWSGALAINLI